MKIDLKFSFLLCFLHLITSILCDDFKCPERGKVGELKVPNVLSLIDKQMGYHASVEVVTPIRKRLVNDYYDEENSVGFIDLEATIRDQLNRRYYYHSTEEMIIIQENKCISWNLTQNEKIDSIKDWFEPTDIIASSEMFKDSIHLGPTVLMIYANNISNKASFVGSELIEGRTVNHWFYCTNPDGPYIDFYFDVKTSLPYRFSLYYPEWTKSQEYISINETQTVKRQVDSASKYVYNYYIFKPLVISSDDPIPYPLGYGCVRKGTSPYTSLPDFSEVDEFAMDMEAIITYSDRELVKTTARVMKRGDVISYEIQEDEDVRFIEMPPPLGRFQVDVNTGRCSYLKPDFDFDVTLVTSWPLNPTAGFNLLYYLVMKPTRRQAPTFIGDIPLGPYRVEEYKAANFFPGSVDAIVDYYYAKNYSDSIPSKVIFTPDRSDYKTLETPTQVAVTIINYKINYIDYEDRFDVSGCYEEPESYTWFQFFFSNPWIKGFDLQASKEQVEKYLTSFIPITRIGEIHAQEVDACLYITVKLYDRVHFIEDYTRSDQYRIVNPSNIIKRTKVEDCEQLCTASPNCVVFSYCENYDCSVFLQPSLPYETGYSKNCNSYSRYSRFDVKPLIDKNYLSTMTSVLKQIKDKASIVGFADLFIVNGPEEIGDISQELYTSDSRTLRAEDFPLIRTDRHFTEAQFKIEKSTLQDCFKACLNDDDCKTLSYCINQNKECILSGETSSSLKDTLEDKTSHADGCNIYQKSFMNLFREYPGKSLVLDAVSTISDVPIADCAKTCAQSNEFNCESFDYCQDSNQRNKSVCFLHVNHIEIDRAHEINVTNWKFAEAGCSHYSKKAELDYDYKFGRALNEDMKESIVGTFDHLSLERCAAKCNTDPDCFTFEFCETIDYDQITDASIALTSCSLTNLRPSSASQREFFEVLENSNKICSIHINRKKITGKSKKNPHLFERSSPKKSSNFNLAIGLGTVVSIIAFAGGFIGFRFSVKKGLISQTT